MHFKYSQTRYTAAQAGIVTDRHLVNAFTEQA